VTRAFLLALALAGPAAALEVPALDGRVNDRAGMLSASSRKKLEAELAAFETRHGTQIAVLTIPSLEGEPIEAYSLKTARAWALGRKGVNDGILFLIAKNDRRMRIEVGHGLEGSLTDALAGRIIQNEVAPRFRGGLYEGGITAGVDAIMAACRGQYVPKEPAGDKWAKVLENVLMSAIVYVSIGTFEAMGLIGALAGWILYFLFAAAWAGSPLAFDGALACLWTFAQLLAIPILSLLLPFTNVGLKFRYTGKKLYFGNFLIGDEVYRPRSGDYSSSDSSSSSGSGFSGGGGSFGGGGASGSW
jgi:uncharacterized protein